MDSDGAALASYMLLASMLLGKAKHSEADMQQASAIIDNALLTLEQFNAKHEQPARYEAARQRLESLLQALAPQRRGDVS